MNSVLSTWNVVNSNQPVHSISYKIECALCQDSYHISLRCMPEDALNPWLPTGCPVMTLIRLRGFTG